MGVYGGFISVINYSRDTNFTPVEFFLTTEAGDDILTESSDEIIVTIME